jgi:hypothetical protein
MMMPISTLQNLKPQTFRAPRAMPSEAPHQSTDVALKRASAASRSGPQRLAALLSGISRNNSYEGRDPLLIPDSLTSGSSRSCWEQGCPTWLSGSSSWSIRVS